MHELFIYLQKMVDEDFTNLILITTLIFLLAPAFLLVYISVYNRRKRLFTEEKIQMKISFDAEIIKTQFEVQEQTMQTIGAELHDNIGQLLSLTTLTLYSIELNDPVKARQKIEASVDLTVRSIKELRLLGKLLEGDQLVGMGLYESIRYQIGWLERSGQFEVNYEYDELPAGNNPDKNLIIFRILQEVLNNIIKHAFATHITIKIFYLDDKLHLQIIDNGKGFNSMEVLEEQTGMGLKNIYKRARIVNGEVLINSRPDVGTSVEIFIPYP